MAKLTLIITRELTTMRKTLTRLALAGAATTVLAGAAWAQMPPPPPAPPAPPEAPMPPPPPPPPMEMMMSMGPDMMFMHGVRHADPEKRAQRLRDILQLRSDQDGALKAYVEATTPKFEIKKDVVIKNKGDKAGDKEEWAEPKPMTTLERLDHMTKAADAMKKRAEATRAFYTALTSAQQKTFDILGMGEGEGDKQVFVRRFDTRAPMIKSDERRIIIQKKVG